MLKEYKIQFLIISFIFCLLLLVLIVSGIIGIINKIKIGDRTMYKDTISVQGQGKVYTKPDIAFINLSVVTEGANIKDVQDENSEKMNGVIEFLKSFGVEDKDIKTSEYNLYPQYDYENRRIPQIIGYEIRQTLEVKVRDLEKVGEILENSVGIGINQVNSLRFGVDNDEELRAEARRLAIEDAKGKAEKLASDLGVKFIKISGFSEGISYEYPTYRELGIGGGGEAPQIETGENEIVVNVSLIYEID